MKTAAVFEAPTWGKLRTDVNALLDEYYREQLNAASRIDGRYGRLWQAMLEVHQAGGKRLRPYVMMLAYAGFGGAHYGGALSVAGALELVHSAMLMHDDIIDRDYVRHGAPNVAGHYLKWYEPSRQAEHYANSAALLAGDMALSGSYQLVLDSKLSDADKITATKLLGEMLFVVTGGELLDAEATLDSPDASDSLKIALLKTASYSFVAPLQIGAKLAGADPSVHEPLRLYGENLGIAFQLADDMLGLFGDETVTGKSVTSDIEEGRPTHLVQRALAMAGPDARQRLLGLMGRGSVTAAQAEEFRHLVKTSGAGEVVEQEMRDYSRRSQEILGQLPVSASVKTALDALAQAAIKRKA